MHCRHRARQLPARRERARHLRVRPVPRRPLAILTYVENGAAQARPRWDVHDGADRRRRDQPAADVDARPPRCRRAERLCHEPRPRVVGKRYVVGASDDVRERPERPDAHELPGHVCPERRGSPAVLVVHVHGRGHGIRADRRRDRDDLPREAKTGWARRPHRCRCATSSKPRASRRPTRTAREWPFTATLVKPTLERCENARFGIGKLKRATSASPLAG